jgi:hypothetical protein
MFEGLHDENWKKNLGWPKDHLRGRFSARSFRGSFLLVSGIKRGTY